MAFKKKKKSDNSEVRRLHKKRLELFSGDTTGDIYVA